MKQGRLVYCCVWLGLFPPSGFKIEAAAGVEPQTQSYISGANLPTSVSIWGGGSLNPSESCCSQLGGSFWVEDLVNGQELLTEGLVNSKCMAWQKASQ